MTSLLSIVHFIQDCVDICQLMFFDSRKEFPDALVHLLVEVLQVILLITLWLIGLSLSYWWHKLIRSNNRKSLWLIHIFNW